MLTNELGLNEGVDEWPILDDKGCYGNFFPYIFLDS